MNKIYQKAFYGVKSAGFTLIELLVVVLITGILAAIALPQYQSAVDKSRIATLLPVSRAIKDAQERYFMANGVYSPSFEELDVQVPDKSCTAHVDGLLCDWGYIKIWPAAKPIYVEAGPQDRLFEYVQYFDHTEKPAARYCYARPENKRSEKICKALGGVFESQGASWTYYRLP